MCVHFFLFGCSNIEFVTIAQFLESWDIRQEAIDLLQLSIR